MRRHRSRPQSPTRPAAGSVGRAGLAAAMVGLIAGYAALCPGASQDDDRLDRIVNGAGGIVLPNVPLPADLQLSARTATTWESGGTHRILLEGDATAAIGSYGFRADNAVLFLTDLEAPGQRAIQIEIYLDNVRELGGHGPVHTRARRLLVTAMINGQIKLDADRLIERRVDSELVAAATARVNRFHDDLRTRIVAMNAATPVVSADQLARRDQRQAAVRDRVYSPVSGAGPRDGDREPAPPPPASAEPAEPTPPVPPVEVAEPVVPTPPAVPKPSEPEPETPESAMASGRVFFSAGKIVAQDGDEEGYILLVGDVTVMYYDPEAQQSLSMSADKAVIFTEPGVLTGGAETDASVVRGVYLEDNVVATSGDYTLRGPRVFYDLRTDRAVVLDAVFYTWSVKRQVPLYLRARKLMQVTRRQWQAEQATLSTSAFYEPHFSIGADHLTLTETRDARGEPVRTFDARDMTGRVGSLPVFYWPHVAGEATQAPVRSVQFGADSQRGAYAETRWNAFALAGVDAPEGVTLDILADFYSKRGPSGGAKLDYDVPRAFGELDSRLMYDYGTDEPGGRDEVVPDSRTRGMAHWQHRHHLAEYWEASVEFSYVSDRTYLEEFFPGRAYTDKAWESSFYVKNQQDDWAFTFLAKYDLLDFTPQMTQLQTPGYTVDKLPEAGYHRIGTSLFDDSVTWFSENRASVVQFNFPTQSPREYGFNAAESMALFAIPSTMPFDEALKARGLDDNATWRLDTRQELSMPLKAGPIDVVPYLVGRITAWGEDFAAYAGNDEQVRFWGQAGIKLHTAFSRTYDEAQSKLLDIERIRHIIEPSVHATFAWTNIDQDVLPVYDYDVESLAEGGTLRFGLRNTFQTQRGEAGNWHSVDVFRLDTDFVIQDNKTLRESPIPHFFNYRPEYSLAGTHFYTEMAWQVTDALATVANVTYSFDSSRVERWDWGIVYDHNPHLTGFLRIRRIDALDSLILQYGVEYLLSAKYHAAISQSLDLEDDETREINVELTRRFPQMLVKLAVSYDDIRNVASVGVALYPEGAPGSGSPERNPFITGF